MSDDKVLLGEVSHEELNKEVDGNLKEIVGDIVSVNDTEQMQRLVQIFNQSIAKKNMIRILKLNGILDKLSEEAFNRIVNHPGAIEDKDIIGYIKVIQGIIDKATESADTIKELPPINVTTNNISIGQTPLIPQDSKEKIIGVVEEILKLSNAKTEKNDEDN